MKPFISHGNDVSHIPNLIIGLSVFVASAALGIDFLLGLPFCVIIVDMLRCGVFILDSCCGEEFCWIRPNFYLAYQYWILMIQELHFEIQNSNKISFCSTKMLIFFSFCWKHFQFPSLVVWKGNSIHHFLVVSLNQTISVSFPSTITHNIHIF